jgi:sarcosine oxidase
VRGYGLWKELQGRSERAILHEPGLLYFGSSSSSEMISMIEGLKALGVKHKVLDGERSARVLPRLRLGQDEIGVFTPEAGWVNAEEALRALYEQATASGAKVCANTRVRREDLEQNFDCFVVCAGAWVGEFVDLDVSVTKHTFAYFEGTMDGPVWIEDSALNPYGFPSELGAGTFKIGIHKVGVPLDPNETERAPSAEALEAAAATARERFGIDRPKMVESRGCLYTSTPTDDFRLGRIGQKGYYASACSGHGFKFGPLIGSILADFVEDKDAPENHPRFSRTR